MEEPADLSINSGLAVLSLRRPAEGNRLGVEMLESLDRAATRLVEERNLRALLIRAEGKRFSVGGAIDEFTASGDLATYLGGVLETGHRTMARLAALPFPVISAVQGPVAGAGIALALVADFVLAGRAMKLCAGYPALGLTPDFGVSWLLTRLAGPMLATDILMSNRTLSASECLAAGLVGRVVDDAALDAKARSLLEKLAKGPTVALAGMKRLVREASRQNFATHLDCERDLMLKTGASLDTTEGIAAFLARKAPVFQGQ